MKPPQEAVWASEEAEAVPMESGVFCRNGLPALMLFSIERYLNLTTWQFIFFSHKQHSVRNER
ncbi:hypothetical protein GH754_08180 [Salinibacillus xinjiangensis]|uniref:Uncharacterized protein n=1 Tax=Salinibacillus xinjiangensis TaxID=1229268 RepID=A0A6G1X5Q9_9BACI|nr:hypothetical protein [Salinibacillus xinjiangensis]